MESKELKEILDKHKKWLDDYEDGVRADLRGADLRGARLGYADLRGVDFRGADLRGANVDNVNYTRTNDCGCGINVAPLEWVRLYYKGDIWKCLIRWEWLCGVCVPYDSDGEMRCERVELIEVVGNA